jgi:hypothetical protein
VRTGRWSGHRSRFAGRARLDARNLILREYMAVLRRRSLKLVRL